MPRLSGTGKSPRRTICLRLRVEFLEDRSVPTALTAAGGTEFHPVVVAGDPNGTEAFNYSDTDSPTQRIDPNTHTSPFAGVGSLQVKTRTGIYIGSGSAISPRHVLTAAHVVDRNGDGKVNSLDKTLGTYFILNLGGNQTHRIAVSKFTVHPDYTGFNNPSVNDDLVILTLARKLPLGTPIYNLGGQMVEGSVLTMVGYGRSGDGINGYTTDASHVIKRVGGNVVDAFYGQDDAGRPGANELFRFDFDGPTGDGPLGRGTLGNTLETTLGSGDSGGPAFIRTDDGYVLAGVNTFTQGNAPIFESMGGGVNLFPYLSFIYSVIRNAPEGPPSEPPGPISADGGGSGIGANPVRSWIAAEGLGDGTTLSVGLAEETESLPPAVTAAPVVESASMWDVWISAPIMDGDIEADDPLVGSDLIAVATGAVLMAADE